MSAASVPLTPSNGRPRYRPPSAKFSTASGLAISRIVTELSHIEEEAKRCSIIQGLNTKFGAFFESAYEYPGRYGRWTMGFINPPIKIEAWNATRLVKITALNSRGEVLMSVFEEILDNCEAIDKESISFVEEQKGGNGLGRVLVGRVKPAAESFTEEQRSKQNSIFSVVRAIVAFFKVESSVDPQLGLYGAFGYDLTFQFEAVKQNFEREEDQRDLVLYLPDEIFIQDKQARSSWTLQYDFIVVDGLLGKKGKFSTEGLPRTGLEVAFKGPTKYDGFSERDHEKGEFAQLVTKAKEEFKVGNLFEVVLGQTFRAKCDAKPSVLYERLLHRNPSPYMFLINLGDNEYLIGASPEMFVRAEEVIENKTRSIQIETCPISGTIRRGANALEDAERIREILTNKKEESELTMCTDVDRNDKSRICVEGSVTVVGRRQIEKYSRLIHTVDHVVGTLRPGFDALDAFLVHTWAVTVTGAPKAWAMQFVEDNEKNPRRWYGGAVGHVAFDGGLNTGLTLRTIRYKSGVAEVRAGATLLYDSDPASEELETELKASAILDAIVRGDKITIPEEELAEGETGHAESKPIVLVIDFEDSFVNTLSSYIRELGADVKTIRHNMVTGSLIDHIKPQLAVMSPGPGNPKSFGCSSKIQMLIDRKVPIFGVCLGMQAMVEHFGGELGVLSYPMHGKPTIINVDVDAAKNTIFGEALPDSFQVGRYHSLYGIIAKLPKELKILALTEEETPVIMALQHGSLPIAGVQFHPESIMTSPALGLRILKNALETLKY